MSKVSRNRCGPEIPRMRHRRRSPKGMKSTVRTMSSPTAVDVSSTFVSSTYVCLPVSKGRMLPPVSYQRVTEPPRSLSSARANMVGESNRGRQSQSSESKMLMKAQVSPLPIIPYIQ